MGGRILLVGNDDTLLLTRSAVVNTRWTSKMAHLHEAVSAMEEGTFDVIVLCHTIGRAEVEGFVRAVHAERPQTGFLVLEATSGSAAYVEELRRNEKIVADVVGTYAPGEMLRAIAKLLQTEANHA